jgi:type I restriction enzyme M protein
MFNEASLKAVQYVMRKDVGVDGDAQRLAQLVWLLFLKVFDDREAEWELFDAAYRSPIPDRLRWRAWAAADEGVTGDELLTLIEDELFPTLRQLGGAPTADLVGEVFADAQNFMKSGTLLRQVINRINTDLDFNRRGDRATLGVVYEQLLHGLQAAGDSGEFYTPRAVVDFMVEMVDPQLGSAVLDPACGTGGFLTATLDHIRHRYVKTPEDEIGLQADVRGVEKKPLPHLLCLTNLMLHGVDVPRTVVAGNALARPLRDYGPADQVDVIVTNPPFRGMEADGVETNFPAAVRTRETADLFLALVMHLLRPGGRAAIVLPDSSLFGEGVKATLRKRLLDDCNLHTVVRLPPGVFAPYSDTIKVNLLFFTKGERTEEIWFYEQTCPFGERYTKTKQIRPEDFEGAREWWSDREDGPRSWRVTRAEIEARDYDLNVDNPHRIDEREAYETTTSAYSGLLSELEDLRRAVPNTMDDAAWPVGEEVRRLFNDVLALTPAVGLTEGFVEELRRAVTDLALRGQLSQAEEGDEDVEETLERCRPAKRRAFNEALRREPPYAIPGHWAWRRLVDVGEFAIGRTPSTREERYWWEEGGPGPSYAWVAIGDMPRRGEVETTAKRITQAGADVFNRDPVPAGALLVAFKLSIGKTAVLGVDAYHNEAIASFEIADAVLQKYLLWALPALVTHAAVNPAIMGGTLNSKTIAALWVPIPPRQEQERIVGALAWIAELLANVADASEATRREATASVKLLGERRALSWVDEDVVVDAE